MTTAASGNGANDVNNHAQFWEDFWNTLYQFTHPFSSTFFDTVFSSKDSSAASSSDQEQHPPITNKPPTAGQARYFKDEASFQRFWEGLQNGTPDESSTGSGGPLDLIRMAWVDFKSASMGFIEAVEWQQTWIQMILAMHLIIFTIIILFRNRPNALAAMLFLTILLAALSEPLNGIGSRHWTKFSNDNYFDSHGVFTGLVWAAPLLVNAMITTMLLLRATVKLLVKVKRAQLEESRRKKQK
ncbi:hypothetical protein FBU30_010356 [Linnemannia zychae]|nr:hypothetical protein FBU30_010356 [Linnemannia zychae]